MEEKTIKYIELLQNRGKSHQERAMQKLEYNRKTLLDYFENIESQKQRFENYQEEMRNIQNNILETTQEDVNILKEICGTLVKRKLALQRKGLELEKKIMPLEPELADKIKNIVLKENQNQNGIVNLNDLKSKAMQLNQKNQKRENLVDLNQIDDNFAKFQQNLVNVNNIRHFRDFTQPPINEHQENIYEEEGQNLTTLMMGPRSTKEKGLNNAEIIAISSNIDRNATNDNNRKQSKYRIQEEDIQKISTYPSHFKSNRGEDLRDKIQSTLRESEDPQSNFQSNKMQSSLMKSGIKNPNQSNKYDKDYEIKTPSSSRR